MPSPKPSDVGAKNRCSALASSHASYRWRSRRRRHAARSTTTYPKFQALWSKSMRWPLMRSAARCSSSNPPLAMHSVCASVRHTASACVRPYTPKAGNPKYAVWAYVIVSHPTWNHPHDGSKLMALQETSSARPRAGRRRAAARASDCTTMSSSTNSSDRRRRAKRMSAM